MQTFFEKLLSSFQPFILDSCDSPFYGYSIRFLYICTVGAIESQDKKSSCKLTNSCANMHICTYIQLRAHNVQIHGQVGVPVVNHGGGGWFTSKTPPHTDQKNMYIHWFFIFKYITCVLLNYEATGFLNNSSNFVLVQSYAVS